MQIFPAKTPEFVKSLFPQFLWQVPSEKKVLYLTFDDGPTPKITEWVLDQLKHYQAKATFFCIGNNIEKYPDIFSKTVDGGHTIGNHTFHHLKGWKTKSKNYLKDIEQTQKIIERSTSTDLFRPPYGKFKITQARQLLSLGYEVVLWDVLSYDWDQNISPKTCFNNVVSKATKGSIIVMHDSQKASKNLMYALPRVLEYFSDRDYVFEALDTRRIPE